MTIPVIVDGDTGYGSALHVIQMVKELIGIGASGVIFEDQTWPKRCGHMRGKSVIDAEEHVQKIRAAVETRGNKPFAIIARTDSVATDGIEEAIRRVISITLPAPTRFSSTPRTAKRRCVGSRPK